MGSVLTSVVFVLPSPVLYMYIYVFAYNVRVEFYNFFPYMPLIRSTQVFNRRTGSFWSNLCNPLDRWICICSGQAIVTSFLAQIQQQVFNSMKNKLDEIGVLLVNECPDVITFTDT